jgi:flavorubredoxin
MTTRIDEVSDNVFRISTFVAPAGLVFNQFLVRAAEPLLFHCGPRALFPAVSEAVGSVLPVADLKWISFGHYEADECGSMNDWLQAAPHARIAFGATGCMVSVNDMAIRAPRPLTDGDVLDLGDRRFTYLATPHVPHGWDAGLLFDADSKTLFCGDLFTALGEWPALSDKDIVAPALEAEVGFAATALTPSTAPTIERLAALAPERLCLMHGPTFTGDCGLALRQLATGYASLFEESLGH